MGTLPCARATSVARWAISLPNIKTGEIKTPLAKFNCKFLVYLAKFYPRVSQCVWQILTLNWPNSRNSEPMLAIWCFQGLATLCATGHVAQIMQSNQEH